MTGAIDTAAASADGKTYTNPRYMTTIVSGGAGNREDESKYVKSAESATGGEERGAAAAAQSFFPSAALLLSPRLLFFPFPSPPVSNYGWGLFQAQNATHATWLWHTSVANKGPKDWTDSLTIIQTGRGH